MVLSFLSKKGVEVKRKGETREAIVAKIGRQIAMIVRQEREMPFDFSADDELVCLASGRTIGSEELEKAVRSFLNRPPVRRRLELFRRLAYLERRLSALDNIKAIEERILTAEAEKAAARARSQ